MKEVFWAFFIHPLVRWAWCEHVKGPFWLQFTRPRCQLSDCATLLQMKEIPPQLWSFAWLRFSIIIRAGNETNVVSGRVTNELSVFNVFKRYHSIPSTELSLPSIHGSCQPPFLPLHGDASSSARIKSAAGDARAKKGFKGVCVAWFHWCFGWNQPLRGYWMNLCWS